MSAAMLCPSLVGRTGELAQLRAALDRASGGVGSMFGILGEAGIGKSRLALTIAQEAGQRGMPVLTGRAVDTGAPMAFRPLFEALSGYFRRVGDDVHPELAGLRQTLSPVVPAWASHERNFTASPPELGEALLQLLMGVGGDRGVVLVLEDLHWADPDTISVVEYLGDNVASTGVVCAVTLRTDTNEEPVRMTRRLASRRAVVLLELGRLGDAELTEMTRLCLGSDVLPGDVEELVRRFSDGLPFLVEELLTTAVSGGALVERPEGWYIEFDLDRVVPRAFEALVRVRLGSLGEDDLRTLSAAALLGPRFDAELLPTVTGQSFEAVLRTLRNGVAAQLLTSADDDPRAFSFRHSLTRDALLGQLLPVERLALARNVLAAIEASQPDLPGELCELAAGLAEQAGDPGRAAERLLLAARRAVRRGALATAEPMLDRAWRMLGRDHDVWREIGLELVAVLTEIGDVDRALEVGGRLLAELPAGPHRATAHLAVARAATVGERWEVGTVHVEQARRSAPVEHRDVIGARAEAIGAEIAVGQDRHESAEAMARAALAVAEREDDHEVACQALLVIGQCARNRSPDEAAGYFDRVIEIARHHRGTWRLRGVMERASLDIWRFHDNENILAARHEALDSGALIVAAHLENFLAWWARDHHEPDMIDAATDRCIELSRKLGLHALAGVTHCAAAMGAAQRGDRAGMEQRLAAAAAFGDASPDIAPMAPIARTWYWLGRDDLPRASGELDAAMELLRVTSDLPMPDRGLWVLVRALEDRDAEVALDELRRSPAFGHAMNQAYASYAAAVLQGRRGDGDAATRLVAVGDVATPRRGWFQHHARRLVAEAALRDGWGEPVRWLTESLACFECGGDAELASSCRTLLARAGAPAPRRTTVAEGVPPDLAQQGVSARELEVLEHLARATATKDIAALLFLSPKTVERHISNLATKLSVNGRSGLVAFAASRFANGDVPGT